MATLDINKAEAVIKEYCDWANMRAEDGLMALVELFPLQYRTFRLWLYHRHPEMEAETSKMYRFLCDTVEYVDG